MPAPLGVGTEVVGMLVGVPSVEKLGVVSDGAMVELPVMVVCLFPPLDEGIMLPLLITALLIMLPLSMALLEPPVAEPALLLLEAGAMLLSMLDMPLELAELEMTTALLDPAWVVMVMAALVVSLAARASWTRAASSTMRQTWREGMLLCFDVENSTVIL